MSERDRLDRRHVEGANDSVANSDVPPPETPLGKPTTPQRRWLVALVVAAAIGLVALPLVFDFGPAERADLPDDPVITVPPSEDSELFETSLSGWQFSAVGIAARDGATYAVSDTHLFVWGGGEEGGALISLEEGEAEDLPPAPIGRRSLSATVWADGEFIVFGGHDGHAEHVDGAAYDPETSTWRPISPAPLEADRFPAAVWSGSEMVVWVENQVAAYSPDFDSWRVLDPPPIVVTDAALLTDGDSIVLIGGPYMRDVEEPGSYERMWITRLDPTSGQWTDAAGGPFADMGRPAIGANGEVFVMTSPSMQRVDGDTWASVGPAHHCPAELAMASGGERVFVKGILDRVDPAAPGAGGCTTYEFDGSWDDAERLLEWNAVGQISESYSSAFLATSDGRLVTFGTSGDDRVLGVYQPG